MVCRGCLGGGAFSDGFGRKERKRGNDRQRPVVPVPGGHGGRREGSDHPGIIFDPAGRGAAAADRKIMKKVRFPS